MYHGQDQYSYGGNSYLSRRNTGPAPECRIEVSPSQPSRTDYFLHVLTAAEASVDSVPAAVLEETDSVVSVRVGRATISFDKGKVGGSVEIAGHRRPFADEIAAPTSDDRPLFSLEQEKRQ